MSINKITASQVPFITAAMVGAMFIGGCAADNLTAARRSDVMLELKSSGGTTTTKFEFTQSPKTVIEVLDQLVREDNSFDYDGRKFLGNGGAYQGSLQCETRDGGRFFVLAERVAADKTDVYLTTTLGTYARTELIKRIKANVAAKDG